MSILGPHGFNPSVTTTVAKFELLDRVANSKGEWIYVQANGAIPVYSMCKIDNDGQSRTLTTGIAGSEPIGAGVAQTAFADNEYGWIWVGRGGGLGKGIKVLALTLCATDVKLYTTGTAGSIDDSATTLIQGLTLVSTNAAGGTVATECCALNQIFVNGA